MSEPRRERRRSNRAWLVVAVILGILVLGDLNRRMANARRLERDSQQLATEVVELETENEQLQTQVALATSEAVVEQWARSEGRMVRQDERLIVPVPAAEVTPDVETEPVDTREPPSNWEVWWALLFGG